MNPYLRTILIVTAISFTFGIGYGFWRAERSQTHLAEATAIRMLCPESWYSLESLEKISKKLSTPIQLFTYANPSEFVRQMANADSKVDVICTSSLLAKSLIQSHWLKKIDTSSLNNGKQLSVDFSNLPYDPNADHTVPVFWNLYGIFGQSGNTPPTLKNAIEAKKIALWGDELIILYLMGLKGMKIDERLNQEGDQDLEKDIRAFIESAPALIKTDAQIESAEALTQRASWTLLPVHRANELNKDPSAYKFWLPEDGALVEIGVLAVGEKSERSDTAMSVINELMTMENALDLHQRLKVGAVHHSLTHLDAVSATQRAEAIRQFPLTRMKFPDISLDSIPRFQKIYDESVTSNRK